MTIPPLPHDSARVWFTFRKTVAIGGVAPVGTRHHVAVRPADTDGNTLVRAWRKFRRDYPGENTMAWEREPDPAAPRERRNDG